MNMLHKSFAGLLLSIILFSCNKGEQVDLSTLQTYHNVAIPLISAEIDVEDMLQGDTGNIISTGNNGELFLAYVTPTTTINAGEIVDIPDQSFSVSVNPAPSTLPVFTGSVNFQDTNVNAFSFPNGEELTSIVFSQGILTINIVNDLSHEVVLSITIPSLVDDLGNSYNDNLVANANNSAVTQANLSNYTFDLTKGANGYNDMVVYLDVTINGSGSPINVSDNLSFSFSMDNLEFEAIYGDLKYQQFDLGSVPLEIDIFKNSENAIDFLLTNPEIKHTIQNSFGFKANMGMQQMYYEDLQGVFLADILYDSSASGNLQAAPFYFPTIQQPIVEGDSVTSILSMNASNSSIDQLINATPKQIISNPVVVVNADSTITNNNFVLSSSEISVSTEITLPLEGYAGGWQMGDTIPFDFKVDELYTSETEISEAVIKFVTTNGWPLEVTFTLKLLDSAYNELSSIADSTVVIQSGNLDANGRVESSSVTITELACDEGCVDNLNETKHVILLVTASTSDYNNQQSVKIYNDYKLGLSMALLISGRIF
jgi:hypothetical protein|tara:strand:+ start:3742 stop:5367 length:1626 start_codon:yes stop_codon:yes gene_type:complete